MATAGGRESPPLGGEPLGRRLFREPKRFEVFQAVRLLEALARERSSGDDGPRRTAVGGDTAPRDEAVRLRAAASLRFPREGVVGLEEGEVLADGTRSPPTLTVDFFGLLGALGALPVPYTELVLRRVRLRDETLRDFLGLFDHRALSLFLRAHEKYRFPLLFERAAPFGEPVPFTSALLALAGFGTGALQGRLECADEVVLRFAGHFSRRPRPVVNLAAMLSAYFELPVEVEQFRGEWLTLPVAERTRLPSEPEPSGRHNVLGVDAVLGRQAFDVTGSFRVRVGPLPWDSFRRFLPTGDLLRPFCHLVRTYVGAEFAFDVVPVLLPNEAPACQVGSEGPDAPRLGWNTWVRTAPVAREFSGVGFALDLE